MANFFFARIIRSKAKKQKKQRPVAAVAQKREKKPKDGSEEQNKKKNKLRGRRLGSYALFRRDYTRRFPDACRHADAMAWNNLPAEERRRFEEQARGIRSWNPLKHYGVLLNLIKVVEASLKKLETKAATTIPKEEKKMVDMLLKKKTKYIAKLHQRREMSLAAIKASVTVPITCVRQLYIAVDLGIPPTKLVAHPECDKKSEADILAQLETMNWQKMAAAVQ